jgi:hypothetical protein
MDHNFFSDEVTFHICGKINRHKCRIWANENPTGFTGDSWSAERIPTAVNLSFLDWSRYSFIQVAPQLSSRGWVDPVPDLLLLRSRTRDLWICSQKLWPLDHRGGQKARPGRASSATLELHWEYGIKNPPSLIGECAQCATWIAAAKCVNTGILLCGEFIRVMWL